MKDIKKKAAELDRKPFLLSAAINKVKIWIY